MTPAFDHSIRMAVHAHATPALTAAMRAVSMIGEPTVLIVAGFAAALWLLRTGRERTALRFAAILAGAEILDQLLKLAFHRPRPAVFFGLAEPMGYSFPSGHSLVSFAFFGALALFAAPRRWWYFLAAAVPIAAIGFSRVYLGMHYPSDVLGGWATAAVWLFVVRLAIRGRHGDRTFGSGSH